MQSDEYVLIQGIDVPKGQPIPSRQEFTKWATETPETSIQVSLFIRALQKFYDVPYDQTLSYFQVAGIHGYPGDLAWNNSAPPDHQRGNKMIYCTHNLITFPTWHRPYMALFEQSLHNCMLEVIDDDLQFNSEADKKAWIDEASKWRLPYWDWALPSSKGAVPDLFQPPSVNIRVPAAADGSLQEPENVPNPLYKYQLKVDGAPKRMGDLPWPYTVDSVVLKDDQGKPYLLPWAKCSGTSRWGIENDVTEEEWSNGINNYERITKAINLHTWYGVNPGDDLLGRPASDLVYRLLQNVPEWKNFSSTGTNPVPDPDKLPHIPWEQWVSLEYLHNNLHGFIGGNAWADGIGHMQNVPSAAFDPIFYMHHANIDRLLALWQTVNPNSWFEGDASPSATDKLTPFHHKFASGKVDYFNSDDVRDWTNFGYTYDALERKPDETDAEYIKRINVYISNTYSSNTSDVLVGDKGKLFTGDLKVTDHTYDDYLIDVLYDRYALGGDPYTILFFLGAAPDGEATTQAAGSVNTLLAQPTWRHVGSVYNFSMPLDPTGEGDVTVQHCANCAKQHNDGVLSTAQIPLTIPLYNAAIDDEVKGISNLSPDEVEPYLASQLSWVAVSMSGTIIPWSRLDKTKIFVVKGKARHSHRADQLSVYSDYHPMSVVTHGREAGALHDEYRGASGAA
ncbi:hypothetical protein B0T19DRAFT_479192 [Cercophora scortea]|uniref:tyrosinase n=1 Tax=Cercophora scortea TaxID=314031 RepID=A0AAE0I808_9PEZI|nr:hypothetical protein B0T19DRAFT_479192 [Cercophora scortea]